MFRPRLRFRNPALRATGTLACFILFISATSAQENRALINDLDVLGERVKRVDKNAPARIDQHNISELDAVEIDLAELQTAGELDKYEQVLSRSLSTRYYNQYRDFTRHRANAELRFLHTVAKLTRSQFEKIEAIAQLEAKRCLLRYCQDLTSRRHARSAGWKDQGNKTARLETDSIDALIMHWAGKNLPPDDCQRYDKEIKARHEYRKQATLDFLTVKLDERLTFSRPQREKVRDLLAGHWTSEWSTLSTPAVVNAGIGALPTVPYRKLGALLNSEQAIILASLRVSRPVSIPIPIVPKKSKSTLVEELEFAPEDVSLKARGGGKG